MTDEGLSPPRWGAPLTDATIDGVEAALDRTLPAAWRRYFQRDRWLEEGWLRSGAFVQIYDPRQAVDLMAAWSPAIDLHPGLFLLGGDGSREMYAVSLADPDVGVVSLDIVSSGWSDATPLHLTIDEFIARLDDGSFDPFTLT